ncbi:hypothetical protein VTP01DRAFT_6850 [Rhizomucor pusillus]|uniref:uncharacterized protein n=1 Tax=Rhizomucor pusillus TaxID=4840 RepID=UPI0037442F96
MSLNCALISPHDGMPVPLPGEQPLFFKQHKVKAVLDCNENGYPGNSAGHWEATGQICLSNLRGRVSQIVFVAQSETSSFKSLNIPIMDLKSWKLQQPWFGANYIEGIVVPTPGGGLPKPGKLTLAFTEGGAIEFTSIYRNLLQRVQETNEMPQHYEPLPPYEP